MSAIFNSNIENENQAKCHHCQKIYVNGDALRQHIHRKHKKEEQEKKKKEEKKFKCVCDKGFAENWLMVRHQKKCKVFLA